MEKLFIEPYLDEDVDILVADLLWARGFSATTTKDAGQLGNTDREQLNYATKNGNTLLTHNRRDFETLSKEFASSENDHCGIIIAARNTPHEIVRRLLFILNNVTVDEIENRIRYI